MAEKYYLTDQQVSKLLHDLRAPVANAQGFKSELVESVNTLSEAIDTIGTALPDEQRQHLSDIINEDVLVCSKMMAASVDKMQERLTELEQVLALAACS